MVDAMPVVASNTLQLLHKGSNKWSGSGSGSGDGPVSCLECDYLLDATESIDIDIHKDGKMDKPLYAVATVTQNGGCGNVCISVSVNTDASSHLDWGKPEDHKIKGCGIDINGKDDNFTPKMEGGKVVGWLLAF